MKIIRHLSGCTERIVRGITGSSEDAALVWDVTRLEESGDYLRNTVGPGYKIGLAIKSFPFHNGLKFLAPQVDAFDVSNYNEYCLVKDYIFDDKELWLTNCQEKDVSKILLNHCRVRWNISSISEFKKNCYRNSPLISLRLDTTTFLKSNQFGHVDSRFGISIDELGSITPEERKFISAFHFHHSFKTKGDEIFIPLVKKCVEILKSFYCQNLTLLNLGGGWGDVSEKCWRWGRSYIPSNVCLMIEPGRMWSERAGWAFSTIDNIVLRPHGKIYLEGLLSPGAHLRWAFPDSVIILPVGNSRKRIKGSFFLGSRTCWERDRLHLFDGIDDIAIGDKILIGGVAGYAMAWNHSFNGIPKLPVGLIDRRCQLVFYSQ